jgi:hypothetical protein
MVLHNAITIFGYFWKCHALTPKSRVVTIFPKFVLSEHKGPRVRVLQAVNCRITDTLLFASTVIQLIVGSAHDCPQYSPAVNGCLTTGQFAPITRHAIGAWPNLCT